MKTCRNCNNEDKEQLTLGELIKETKAIMDKNPKALVKFDFANAYPQGFHCWSSSLEQLAMDFGFNEPCPIRNFLNRLNSASYATFSEKEFEKEFGEFTMTEDTPLWVEKEGATGSSTMITGIKEYAGDYAVISTEFCDYKCWDD